MAIAIFCRETCPMAVKVVNYFHTKKEDISLVVMETAIRKKYSKAERQFIEAHAEFEKYLYPVSRPDLRAKTEERITQLADKLKIPLVKVDYHSSEATKAALERYHVFYVLLSSSAWLIKDPLLSMEKVKIINAHCAKLPKHRSLDSLPWSVVEGDEQIGLTAHFIDIGIDTGPILHFMEVPPLKGDNLITLRRRVDDKKPEIFYTVISGLKNGHLVPVPQTLQQGTHHWPMTISELILAETKLQSMLKAH